MDITHLETPEAAMVTLHPGESFTTGVDLGKYLRIQKPGKYRVRGTFHFRLVDPAHGASGAGKVPWHILWDDYAANEFEFQVN